MRTHAASRGWLARVVPPRCVDVLCDCVAAWHEPRSRTSPPSGSAWRPGSCQTGHRPSSVTPTVWDVATPCAWRANCAPWSGRDWAAMEQGSTCVGVPHRTYLRFLPQSAANERASGGRATGRAPRRPNTRRVSVFRDSSRSAVIIQSDNAERLGRSRLDVASKRSYSSARSFAQRACRWCMTPSR